MESRLIFRHCEWDVMTRRGRRRIAETALLDMGLARIEEGLAGKSAGPV